MNRKPFTRILAHLHWILFPTLLLSLSPEIQSVFAQDIRFQHARTACVTVVVDSNNCKGAVIPFGDIATRLLIHAGKHVVAGDNVTSDIILNIRADIKALSAQYNYSLSYFTGAIVSGEIVFQSGDSAQVIQTFHSKVDPPGTITMPKSLNYQKRYQQPRNAPFSEALANSPESFLLRLTHVGAILFGVQTLVSALDDEYFPLRLAAVKSMGNLQDTTVVESLLQVLQPGYIEKINDGLKSSEIKQATFIALGKLQSRRATLPLLHALQSKYSPRRFVIEALGSIGDESAVEPLIPYLDHHERQVRDAVVMALAAIETDVAPRAIGLLDNERARLRSGGARVLGTMKVETALPALIHTLRDSNVSVRIAGTWALGEIGNSDAVPVLIETLQDSQDEVRKAAATALGKIRDVRALDALAAALPEKEVVEALLSFDSLAAPVFINALNDTSTILRLISIQCLGTLKDGRAVHHLIALLGDKTQSVSSAAIKALGQIKDPTAVDPLIEAMRNAPNQQVYEICNSIRQITGVIMKRDYSSCKKWWKKNKKKYLKDER